LSDRSSPETLRPAISRFVRILLGIVGVFFLVLGVFVLLDGDRWFVLLPLAFAALFLLPAFFATGPPTGIDAAGWAHRRYRRLVVIRLYAGFLGLTGIGLLYVFRRIDSSEPWAAATQEVSGILIAVAIMLEFVQAYYRHYVQETTKQNGYNPVERSG